MGIQKRKGMRAPGMFVILLLGESKGLPARLECGGRFLATNELMARFDVSRDKFLYDR